MKRVLVCDDEPHIAMLHKLGLRRAGCEVDTGCDGREAKEALATVHYDAAVLDLVMPHFDGVEVLAYLREVLHSDMPVYLVTQSATEGLDDEIRRYAPVQILSSDGSIDWRTVMAV